MSLPANPTLSLAAEHQGAGAVDAGRAVTLALADRHTRRADYASSPLVAPSGISFLLHDHRAGKVEVFGGWNDWRSGAAAIQVEPGLWEARLQRLPSGSYPYKFLLDGYGWLVDPANPVRATDEAGNWNSVLRV